MESFEKTSEQPPNEEKLRQQVGEVYEEILELPAVSEALDLLDDLPEYLKYHNKEHALDVIHEVILFTVAAGEPRDVLEQEAVKAAWHDVGYIKQAKDNEPIAVEMFKESKSYQNLPEAMRQEITAGILDTQLKITAKGPAIEQERASFGYLLDADTSNFGRDDFFAKMRLMAVENNIDLDNLEEKQEFIRFTLALLENHTWKTQAATDLRQEKKEENLAKLRTDLRELRSEGGQ